jgi:PIN domain nuclease of toxin-antitoxin system
MNLLLDTHILLWSLLDPGRLTPDIAAALTHPDNTLWISPITTWEILVLSDKQRLQLDRDPAAWMREILQTIPLNEAPLNHEVALRSRAVRLQHQDPADRFLAATAGVYDLTLVTMDRRLMDCPDIDTLGA